MLSWTKWTKWITGEWRIWILWFEARFVTLKCCVIFQWSTKYEIGKTICHLFFWGGGFQKTDVEKKNNQVVISAFLSSWEINTRMIRTRASISHRSATVGTCIQGRVDPTLGTTTWPFTLQFSVTWLLLSKRCGGGPWRSSTGIGCSALALP